jgi:hypothetical protein
VQVPRGAARGGVNGPALPVQRGRESPLSIDIKADAPEKLIKDYSDRLPN